MSKTSVYGCTQQGMVFRKETLLKILKGEATRQTERDYVRPGLSMDQEIDRAYRISVSAYEVLQDILSRTDGEETVRQRAAESFTESLLYALGYRVRQAPPAERKLPEGVYAASFVADDIPVVAVTSDTDPDAVVPDTEVRSDSYLNGMMVTRDTPLLMGLTPEYGWAMTCNCKVLRLLHLAQGDMSGNGEYIEFDLEKVLGGGNDGEAFKGMWRLLCAGRENGGIWDAWSAE